MSDSDKIFLRGETIVDGTGVLPSQGNSWIANDVMLGRSRWTTGATVLQQPDCQPGAWQIQPGDRILRHWRVDGTAEADDEDRFLLSTPIRGDWHSDDNSGATPPLDNRVVKGDSCQIDTGSGDSYVLHYDGSRFRGYGVLAEYRTAATAIVTSQASDAIGLRSSVWDTGAAKYRDWIIRSIPSDTSRSQLRLYTKSEGGSEFLNFQFQGGTSCVLSMFGTPTNNSVPVLTYTRDRTGSNPGQISCVFAPADTDQDGTEIWFQHGDSTRFARHRFRGSDAGALGADAEVLSASYRLPATALATTRNSASLVFLGNYWDGAVGVEAAAYAQHVLTGTDPAGYLRHGFGYGVGTSDHYSDGAVLLTMDREGASAYGGALTLAPHEVSGPSTADFIHSPYYSALAYSGVAGGARSIAWNAQIDSDADADDRWSLRFVAVGGGGPSEILGVRDTGEIIPADGSAGVLELSAALGTHSGTTASDKTGNASIGTIKVVDASGAIIGHIPIFSDT